MGSPLDSRTSSGLIRPGLPGASLPKAFDPPHPTGRVSLLAPSLSAQQAALAECSAGGAASSARGGGVPGCAGLGTCSPGCQPAAGWGAAGPSPANVWFLFEVPGMLHAVEAIPAYTPLGT